MPKITLPDGSVKEFENAVTGFEVAMSISEGLARATVAAKVNGVIIDINESIEEDAQLSLITAKDDNDEALYLLRHSCAHVMAEAIMEHFPDAKLVYGPPLDNGFYYDIEMPTPLSSDDFAKIEASMKKIVKAKRKFSRYELSAEEGRAKLQQEGSIYKIDNAERALEADPNARLSWYATGTPGENWEDLCRGPHVPDTGKIGGFKVMSLASSYWKGNADNQSLTRVYGTAFYSKKTLTAHLERLEEARKRDHRIVGKELGLFAIDDEAGQGLVLWKPKGSLIRTELQNFIGEHLTRQGYYQVYTPHIGKLDLYRTSGHFPYYQDSQFPPLVSREQIAELAEQECSCGDLAMRMEEGEIDGYMLRPMNCPHHIKIYSSEKRSYRDLPVRLAEFGAVYRWEQSGELSGMTRVRGFTQDDAHIFCREDQVADEVQGCLELVGVVFKTLGMNEFRVRVGLRDPDSTKFVGDPEQWDKAEAACIAAAESLGVPYEAEAGEAAFYGPKIDFVVKDVIGREWQLGTVQVDYQLPERFDLNYVGSDNKEHRPVMIHRAPFGSMERFVGLLIEHFNGAFPLWLAPDQVRVLPVSDKFIDYADQVFATLKGAGFRVSLDDRSDRVQAKIRDAQNHKIPYMLIVGGRDRDNGTVSIRERAEGDLGALPLDDFMAQLIEERNSKGESRIIVPKTE